MFWGQFVCFMLSVSLFCVFSLVLSLIVRTSAKDSKMTDYVFSGMLDYALTCALSVALRLSPIYVHRGHILCLVL